MYSSICIVLVVILMTNRPNLALSIGLPELADAHTSVHSDASSTDIIDSSSSRRTTSATVSTAAAPAATATTTTTDRPHAADGGTMTEYGGGGGGGVASDLLQPTLPNIVGDLSEDYDTLERRRRIQVGLCEMACIKKMNIRSSAVDELDTNCLLTPECTKCWQECDRIKSQPPPPLWPVHIASMVKQEFLVSTHLAWKPSKSLRNCFVTWEVAGGGLVGNLLTDASTAELSLWPDTKYRVQVTCKSRRTGKLVKSPTLIVNTSHAISMQPDAPSTDSIRPIADEAAASAANSVSNSVATVKEASIEQPALVDSLSRYSSIDSTPAAVPAAIVSYAPNLALVVHREFLLGVAAAFSMFLAVAALCRVRRFCRRPSTKSYAHPVAIDDR